MCRSDRQLCGTTRVQNDKWQVLGPALPHSRLGSLREQLLGQGLHSKHEDEVVQPAAGGEQPADRVTCPVVQV